MARLQASSEQRHAKKMEPVYVNGSVHTACKQHQRVCVRICAHASLVDEALEFGPRVRVWILGFGPLEKESWKSCGIVLYVFRPKRS